MFRYRRYRVFLVLAVLTIFLLYRISHSSSEWDSASISKVIVPNHFANSNQHSNKDSESRLDQSKDEPYIPDPPALPQEPAEKILPDPYLSVPKPTQRIPQDGPKHGSDASNPLLKYKGSSDSFKHPPHKFENVDNGSSDGTELVMAEGGQGRMTQDHLATQAPIERWSSRSDHFAIPTESIIPLPTGSGKPIPKIQATFKAESAEDKTLRLQHLSTIKEAFLHSWSGYKTYAWGKDELKPLTGKSKNTFNGWSATLVDSLDTMWMMGLKEEFEEALEFVKTIDFHTSQRMDIPLFETTIRYLGGLLGAYDVSDAKYPILLEKATMLGDILMGTFDTPNRMPITFFNWRPAFTSQPHRAPARVVLAEIGSLQMEFTRLAQLTGNNTYYDAITRIMNALEEWQDKTAVPGLWPADIDTSGCNTTISPFDHPVKESEPTFISSEVDNISNAVSLGSPVSEGNSVAPSKSLDFVPLEKPDPLVFKVKPGSKNLNKRQVGHIPTDHVEIPPNSIPDTNIIISGNHHEFSVPQVDPVSSGELQDCVSKGLDYTIGGWSRYTLGSTADSAFEYLSKMYILLNGQVEGYRTMFEKAMDAANERLIFRIMIPNSKRELYASGEISMDSLQKGTEFEMRTFKPELTHLTCFVGGMFAMGSRLFDRPSDLDIAAKLTDACVWAYESTATGIMPESFLVTPCANRKDCAWNETHWFFDIDPNAEAREEVYEQQMRVYSSQIAEQSTMPVKNPINTAIAESSTTTTTTATSTSSSSARTSPTSDARGIVTAPQEGDRSPPPGFDPHAHPALPKVVKHTDTKKPEDIPAPQAMRKRKPDWYKRSPPGFRPPGYNPAPPGGFRPTPATAEDEAESAFTPPTMVEEAAPIWSPDKVMSREEYAKARIEEERLSPGMKQISDPRYLLRYVYFPLYYAFSL
jgi:mannosyl-oligosaccharide alpha-1,2-mannosidase